MTIIAPIPRDKRRLMQKTIHKMRDKNHARRLTGNPPGGALHTKKGSHVNANSSAKYGGEGELTRCVRRYSAHPWASPLRGQRKRCSKMLPAFLCGQSVRRLTTCPTGCASCRTPVGGSYPPGRALYVNSTLKVAPGGLTRCARRYSAHPWASPLRGQRKRCSKMLPAFLCGQPSLRLVCPTGYASCRTPVGGSHPPR